MALPESRSTAAAGADWDRVHADFPVNRHLIWLNNCGTTPVSDPVRLAVTAWLEEYGRRGSATEAWSYAGVRSSIQRRLEALLGARRGEIALIHHTSEGMNFISHGLSLDPQDEILLLENEYPSNVYPWEHWAEKGIGLRRVPMAGTPGDFLAGFREALGPRVRAASMSAVHWCTGMPFPLEAMGSLAAERGTALIVDGSQGVGLVDLDVKAAGIRYMAFSGWKWLLGPLGLGALYIDRDHLESLRPIFKGTESVPGDQEYLPYKHAWKPTADRFTLSTGSMTDWVYFDASLAYLDALGFARVRERIRALSRRLADGLRAAGYGIHADAYPEAASGIVSALRPGQDAAAVVRDLKDKGIIAAARLGRIRLAPHVYISEGQIDAVVEALAARKD
jgi:cysteine desulfurase / selenocysteine lyase